MGIKMKEKNINIPITSIVIASLHNIVENCLWQYKST